MTIYDAAREYLIYLQALRLQKKDLTAYRDALRHIVWFYGKKKPLELFDNATTLQYVKLYDPFDCNPLHEERGEVYCKFVHWLMQNQLIPAWSGQLEAMDEQYEHETDSFAAFDDLAACE